MQVRPYSAFDDSSLTRNSHSRFGCPQQFPLCTRSRASTWQSKGLPEGNPRNHSERDRGLGRGLRQVTCLLAERAGWDWKKYHRTDNRREDVRGRTSRGFVLLLTGLRGPKQPPLHLPHPGRPACTKIPRGSINHRPASAVGSRNCPRDPVQPDEEIDCGAAARIYDFDGDRD